MREYINTSKRWRISWLTIWIIMYLAVIVAYPSDPSLWFGWLPSSVMITFGLMIITLVLGYIFCKQRFKI